MACISLDKYALSCSARAENAHKHVDLYRKFLAMNRSLFAQIKQKFLINTYTYQVTFILDFWLSVFSVLNKNPGLVEWK